MDSYRRRRGEDIAWRLSLQIWVLDTMIVRAELEEELATMEPARP